MNNEIETEEDFELSNSIPIATITGSVWDETARHDFVEDTKSRFGGVDKQTFEAEVQAWSDGFKRLPQYDRNAYTREIMDMEMHFQSDNTFDFDTLAEMYSSQVANRSRLAAMKNIVNAHHEIYNQAYKSLDKQAFRLFSKAGGSVDDRRADAAHVVAPFLRLVSQAKELLDQVEEAIAGIEFAATQLSRLLREREALAKINPGYDREGQHSKLHSQKRVDEDGYEEV